MFLNETGFIRDIIKCNCFSSELRVHVSVQNLTRITRAVQCAYLILAEMPAFFNPLVLPHYQCEYQYITSLHYYVSNFYSRISWKSLQGPQGFMGYCYFKNSFSKQVKVQLYKKRNTVKIFLTNLLTSLIFLTNHLLTELPMKLTSIPCVTGSSPQRLLNVKAAGPPSIVSVHFCCHQ